MTVKRINLILKHECSPIGRTTCSAMYEDTSASWFVLPINQGEN